MPDRYSRDVENEDGSQSIEIDLDGDEDDGGVVINIPTN